MTEDELEHTCRNPCNYCETPDSAVYALMIQPHAKRDGIPLWNYQVCPDCLPLMKAEYGRMIIEKAPFWGPPNPNARPFTNADARRLGYRDWHACHEYERYQDDLEWDAQRHG